jgi:hypothetical protein
MIHLFRLAPFLGTLTHHELLVQLNKLNLGWFGRMHEGRVRC